MKTLRKFRALSFSLVFILGLCVEEVGLAQTVVTTYVTKVQEERKSTRWTLTEWLRIKERMKMMDVWLAMFSDPAKDKFRPELSIHGGLSKGAAVYEGFASAGSRFDLDGFKTESTYGGAQLWLTNLISSQVGIRMLNVNLGADYYMQETDFDAVSLPAEIQQILGTTESELNEATRRTEYYAGNLRIFGQNIQDSSLVLRYGEWKSQHLPSGFTSLKSEDLKGKLMGGDLQLYIANWLGLEGKYTFFEKGKKESLSMAGDMTEYGLFIEISLFRFYGGLFSRDFEYEFNGQSINGIEAGTFYGLKLQL